MNLDKTHFFGIWLDQNKALIINMDERKTIILPVFKSNGKKHQTPKSDNTAFESKDYFTSIASALPQSSTVFIIGPDQTKFLLKDFMEKELGAQYKVITKVASHLSTSDIIARLKSYFHNETEQLN